MYHVLSHYVSQDFTLGDKKIMVYMHVLHLDISNFTFKVN